ncbi:MAG: hypothetical protein HY928_12255 [Elusimicrobia bacterium]|nr:hypothetical protein [Elusimicrobiota bacterium]
MYTTLTSRFPRAKSTWLETLRPQMDLSASRRSTVFVPRIQRKHPLKSKLSGIVY